MAEIENVIVFHADAERAVQTIGELRENIREYKKQLENANLTEGEHQKILENLQINQAALKNAMHGTASTMEEIARDAKALNVQFDA